jgi:hypothetical protein
MYNEGVSSEPLDIIEACECHDALATASLTRSRFRRLFNVIGRLSELLAIVHRDNGQYEAAHGIEKAVADAQVRVASERTIPEDCDVRKILQVRVVPGDGDVYKVYAKNVGEVEALLMEFGERLEDFESHAAPTMTDAARFNKHTAQILLHESACECMSPEQADKYEALFVGADDLPLRFLRCIMKRIAHAEAKVQS